jgi:CRISPR/Cas system-associated exonuclease Cas4 (RecB family)
VTAFYSLPDKKWKKKSVVFSPSSAGECSRKLYYEFTDAEQDPPKPKVAWQGRVSRVGDGLHIINQEDAKKMPSELLANGIQPDWRVKTLEDGRPAIEAKYERTFTVELDGETFEVKIRGRLDAIIEFINEDGEVDAEAILDYKIKTRLAKLAPSSIRSEIAKYRPQMTAYTLITDIPNVIIELESSEKPKWSDTDDPNRDEKYPHIVPTDAERQQLLQKFAAIVRCIRDGTVPAAEKSYGCTFCPFQQQCQKDS